ncbi:MAG: hypothetical protein LBP20_10795 [Treponema sp.]|jgi:hypothetical protein|nr:hypothetical protein [Treponema sp.]
MKISRPVTKPLITIVIKRMVLFFFALAALTEFFYGIGTSQGFMDVTQLFLLRVSRFLGFFLAVCSLCGMAALGWFILRDRQYRFIGGAGIYLLLTLAGAALFLGASLIMVIAGGNIPVGSPVF